jgi:hypothetical protein
VLYHETSRYARRASGSACGFGQAEFARALELTSVHKPMASFTKDLRSAN